MNLLYHYTIPLDPRTKKNHQMIAGSGARCPLCKKPAKQFVRQSVAHDQYHMQAEPCLHPRPSVPICTPVAVVYRFYMQTRRRVDCLNLCACADDLLVDAAVLKDDNSNIIISHDGSRVFYDKENPRTEIYIYEYSEKEDIYGEEHSFQSNEVPRSE